MAKSIQFFRNYVKIDSLKDSFEIEQFTEIFDKLFDIFNRKYPAEGIKMNSNDFEVYSIYNFYDIDF